MNTINLKYLTDSEIYTLINDLKNELKDRKEMSRRKAIDALKSVWYDIEDLGFQIVYENTEGDEIILDFKDIYLD